MTLKKEFLKTIVRKGENAGNQHFLHFPQCFLPFPNQISISSHIYFKLDKTKILSFSKELIVVLLNPLAHNLDFV